MSTLSGNSIDSTYQGLLKTSDNAALSGTLKTIEDGAGNSSPIQLSTTDGKILSNNFIIADSTETFGLAITGTEAQAAGPWDYTGTHDFSAATVIGIGGGGGATAGLMNTTRPVHLGGTTLADDQMRVTYFPTTYGTSTFTLGVNFCRAIAITLNEGQTLDKFGFYVTSAGGTGGMDCAIYKSTIGSNGGFEGGEIEVFCGNVDISTTGYKKITGIAHTLGATTDNVYWIFLRNASDASVSMMAATSTSVSGGYHASLYATTSYRGYTYQTFLSTTPSSIGSPVPWTKSTDFPMIGVSN